MAQRKISIFALAEFIVLSFEFLDFGPYGRRPLVRFARDDRYAALYCLVILNAVKNLGSRGF